MDPAGLLKLTVILTVICCNDSLLYASPVNNTDQAPARRFEGLKAVVAGATGGVGKAIVQRLVREGVLVTALVRDVRDAVSRGSVREPRRDAVA